jgi:hypothetical protein
MSGVGCQVSGLAGLTPETYLGLLPHGDIFDMHAPLVCTLITATNNV